MATELARFARDIIQSEDSCADSKLENERLDASDREIESQGIKPWVDGETVGAIPNCWIPTPIFARSYYVCILRPGISYVSCQPFRHSHSHPEAGHEQRLYDELYTSNAWLEAHETFERQPKVPGCQLECYCW